MMIMLSREKIKFKLLSSEKVSQTMVNVNCICKDFIQIILENTL